MPAVETHTCGYFLAISKARILSSRQLPVIDNLFTQISTLVYKFVELQNLPKTKEQILLISKMFQVQNEFEKANDVLESIDNKFDLDLI